MQTVTLNARPRTERGKNAARKVRQTGRVPAVLYGHGDQPRALSLDAHELGKLLGRISVENTLIDLEIEGAETTRALIREVQTHPYRPDIVHVDLFHVHAGEKLRLQVPVRLTGTPVGVHVGGGVLDQVLYDLEVECLPGDIPDAVEIDVSGLDIGESARVHDVSVPRVKVLNDGDLPIASVVQPTREELPETPETSGGPGNAIEPELIRGSRGPEADASEEG